MHTAFKREDMKYAAEMFTRAHHPALREEEYYMQVERYREFGQAMAGHFQQVANKMSEIANDALNCSYPKPFIIDTNHRGEGL